MNLRFTLICLLFFGVSFTQKEANVWHFGIGNSLDFNSGTPVQTSGSQMFTFEGSTSYCDENGNLLFYSNGGGRIPAGGQDGGKIWNKNNQVMYDMQGTKGGGWSAAQSSVVVPAPGEPNVYYLFTMEELEFDLDGVVPSEPNGKGLRYFKIDMSLNGGLGDVVEADVQVYDYSYEGLCAIRHSNETDYWILINQDTTGIGVYSVTQNGVQLAGVYPYPAFYSGFGIIKSSPTQSGVGAPCCNKVMTSAGLYDFNLSTGVLTLESDLGAASPNYFEFSPNGFYLYASIFDPSTLASNLVQYNVFATSQTGQTVESTAQVIVQNFNGFYLQLAPDGKIYFTEPINSFTTTLLGTINCPNTSDPTVFSGVFSYENNPAFPNGFFSLPNFPSWIFYNSYEAQIQFGPDTVYICPGDTLLLNAGEGTSWSWGGDAVSNTSQFFTVTSPGIFSATVTSSCGLGSDQVVVLPCVPNWQISISNDTSVCFGDNVSPALLSNTGGIAPFTYEWSFNGNLVSTVQQFTFSPTQSGTACLTVTDANGDTLSECLNITVNPPVNPQFSLLDTVLCWPKSFKLINETNQNTFTTQTWLVNNVAYSNQETFIFNPIQPGTYSIKLLLTNSLGCEYDTLISNTLLSLSSPDADFSVSPTEVEVDNPLVSFTDQSSGQISSWNWMFFVSPSVEISTAQNPQFLFPNNTEGNYKVQLVVSNSNGCSDSLIRTVIVFENYTLFVPNSFSPDGNEYNNLFEVSGYGINPQTFLLQIYNRWGELIFVSKDPEKGWDGSYGNTLEMAPIGTYTYNLNYKLKNQDQPKSISGHVNLIR